MSTPSTVDIFDRPAFYERDEHSEPSDLTSIEAYRERLAQWTNAGLFTRELVTSRLTKETLRDLEHMYEGVRSSFADVASNGRIDEPTFTTLLVSKISLPEPIVQAAGPVLFKILAYNSTLPFPGNTPTTLDIDELIRGIAIFMPSMNPLSKGSQTSNYVVSRGRTSYDDHRVIFQGLASPGPSIERQVLLFPPKGEDFWIDISREDPRMTDLLDALVASQPDQRPGIAKVPRSFFKDLAAELIVAQGIQPGKLGEIQVSKEDLEPLVRLTVALVERRKERLGEEDREGEDADLEDDEIDVDKETESVLRESFGEGERVGWARFHQGVLDTDLHIILEHKLRNAFGIIFNLNLQGAYT